VTRMTRLGGALLGFGLLGLPGVFAATYIEAWVNPGFVDGVPSYWALCVALPGLLGAAIGAWRGGPWGTWLFTVPALSAGWVLVLGLTDGVRPIPELRVLVVGLDGATWTQIDPMVARGELPNLASVEHDGAHGVMTASGPLFSPLLWTSMAAGKDHDAHGIRGFRVHANDAKVPMFFDIAEHEGRSIGLYKWLVTWPPRTPTHGGYIVPGWIAPSPETSPPELSFVKELELSSRLERQKVAARRPMWRLALEGLLHGFRWTTLRDAAWYTARGKLGHDEDEKFYRMNLLRGRMDRDVAVWSMRTYRPALATFTYYATDAFGHRFWEFHEPAAFPHVDPDGIAKYGQAIPDAYRQGDEILGELRRFLPADGRLVVVSDHGFQAMDAATSGIRIAPRTEALEKHLAAEVGTVQVGRVGARVTVMLGDADRDGQRAKLDAFMATITHGPEHLPLFRWATNPDDPGQVVIDLKVTAVPEAEMAEMAGPEPVSAWVGPIAGYSGDHNPSGIFAAVGPGVDPGGDVDVGLLDIAPIVLAGLGLAQGDDMPGKVPPGIWPAVGTVPSWDFVRAELVFPSTGGAVDDDEMLKQLGYVQ
jgi:hypothetical protein